MRPPHPTAAILTLLWLLACGRDPAPPPAGSDSGVDEMSADGGRAGGAGGGDGAIQPAACPGRQPDPGSPCPAGASCTWGEQPQPTCRTRGVCGAGGTWTVTPPPDYCAGLAATCPAAAPSTSTQTCQEMNRVCLYADTKLCSCVPCNCTTLGPPGPPCLLCPPGQPAGTLLWACQGPPSQAPGCPPVVPNDGAPCDLPAGTACPAPHCGSPFTVVCTEGRWRWTSTQVGLCPVAVRLLGHPPQ